MNLIDVDDLDDRGFVELAYRVVLQRVPDQGGLQDWMAFLGAGNWRKDLVVALVGSEEFRTLGTEPLLQRLHRARQEWITTLPPAATVLDIGGSSPTDPSGALKEMGWTGTPERLTIVDLPPDDQYHGRPVYSQDAAFTTSWGGEVVYLHARAEDLAGSDALDGVTFDAVFMGQAIEHIEVGAVPGLLGWIHDHLAADGWLALDTPNRAVTILQTGPDVFTDPDHTTEYDVPAMERLLADAGFRIHTSAGIMPCVDTVRAQQWDPLPTYRGPLTDDDVIHGWAMGLLARPA